jgi:adenylylsulfate kinase-like enzyme
VTRRQLKRDAVRAALARRRSSRREPRWRDARRVGVVARQYMADIIRARRRWMDDLKARLAHTSV